MHEWKEITSECLSWQKLFANENGFWGEGCYLCATA